MSVRYAQSYVDRLFAERDLSGLVQVISATREDRPLPEEFLFLERIFAFVPYRSGVWQHYEHLPKEIYQETLSTWRRFGFQELANRYEQGWFTWQTPEIDQFDDWLDLHTKELHAAALALIAPLKSCLYPHPEPASASELP